MLYGSAFAAGLAANHLGRRVLALRDIHRAAVEQERHTNVVRLLTPYKTEHHIDLVRAHLVEVSDDAEFDQQPAAPHRLHSVTG